MRKQYSIQIVCLLLFVAALALASCKKHIAAAPPAATPVQPAPPPPAAPAITLRAAPSTIDRGQSATLQWDAKNATAVRIDPDLGGVQNSGSRPVNPASSVTYTATATGPGGSASDAARVTVRIPAAPPARSETPRTQPAISISELFRQNVGTIYFDYDKADVRFDQVARLEANAAWLKQHPEVKFTIEGNCDERGSEEYNLGLGDRRANAVKEFLVKQGISQSRINTLSYGEERPVCRVDNESCYQKNRRDDFAVTPQT